MKRRSIMSTGLTPVLVLVSTGCAPDRPASEAFMVTDSAGVAIANNTRSLASLPTWSLGPVRTTVGVLDGAEEYQLFRVSDALRLQDGSIVVANGGTHELRRYRPDGTLITEMGREGQGPGEFGFPMAVWSLGDSVLAVWDSRLRRFSRFDLDGDFLGQVTPEEGAMNPEAVGLFRDESFILSDLRLQLPETGFEMVYQSFVRYGPGGERIDSLPRQPYQPVGLLAAASRRLVGGPLFVFRPGVAATGDSYWFGPADHAEVLEFGLTGALRRIVRWIPADRTITDRDVEAHWQTRIDGAGESQRGLFVEMREVQPVADQFPAYDLIGATTDGHLWVRDYDRPPYAAPHRWTIFDPGGRLVARIETPRDLRIFEIGHDYVLGVDRDELDVERLRLHELVRGGEG